MSDEHDGRAFSLKRRGDGDHSDAGTVAAAKAPVSGRR